MNCLATTNRPRIAAATRNARAATSARTLESSSVLRGNSRSPDALRLTDAQEPAQGTGCEADALLLELMVEPRVYQPKVTPA